MIDNEVSVRYSTANQIDEIFDVLSYLNDSFVPSLDTQVDLIKYSKKISQKGEVIFLIRNNQIIGMTALYLNNKNCFITSFGIHKKYFGQGLSDFFMEKTFEILKENLIENIKLEVHRVNTRAIKFYKRKGFKIVSQDKDRYLCLKTI